MNTIRLFLCVFLCLLLSACTVPREPAHHTALSVTVPETTDGGTEPTQAYSSLHLPGVSVEDVVRYFNEVCLDAEFVTSGDPSVVQKWTQPICYTLSGQITPEDRQVLAGFVQWLNTVEGFPGMEEARENQYANLRIYFCTPEELVMRMGEQFSGLDGAVTFWYEQNEIYDAIICCRSDLDQDLRNSVLQEELYNGLGPVQDTDLRLDSIIYSGFSQPQSLTEIDKLILTLLYHPRISCGMDAQQCETVIRELYD